MRFLLLTCLLLAASADAQEGTALYEVTTRLDIQLPPEMAHLADQIPSTRTEERVLSFRDGVSMMKAAPRDEEEAADFESGGMRMMFRRSDNQAVFVDRDEWRTIERRDFLSRTFLIDGEPEELAWRLSDEQAEFLGYAAFKATAMRDTVEVEAWFTPEIPVSAGPGPYGGLPGLILVLTEDDARRTYIATEVTLGALAEDAIEAPTGGRNVTREEYNAIVREKMEEMGRGRGGRIIMRG